MRWLHSGGRPQSRWNGLADWTSAAWPRSNTWRWAPRTSSGSLIRLCPLREFCPELELDARLEVIGDPVDGPVDGGGVAIWWMRGDADDPMTPA